MAVALVAPATSGAQGSRVFVFAQSSDPQKLDPALIEDGNSARVTEQIFETLLEFDGPTTRLKPALAENWTVTPDGKEWTFFLRQGVLFHDMTPFDANAVKFNFDRWQTQAGDPFHKPAEFIYWSDVAGFDMLVDRTEVVDSSTFKVYLKDANGPFLLNLALFPFAIVSPTALQTDVEDLSRNPVGTGPFRFVEWVRGDQVTLAAFDQYWGGRPEIDTAIVRSITDGAARYFELQAGNIDLMEFPNPDDVRGAMANADLQVLFRPSLNVGYIDFNQFQAPFSDARVRTALALAINRQGIVESLYGGSGVLAKQLLAPGMLGYNDDLTDIPYDPNFARELLKAAGLPNGFTTEFWYMPVARPYYPTPDTIAQAVCSDWAAVGVKCELKTKDWAAYRADARNHKFPTWMLGWTGDNGDPDNFLFFFFGTFSGKDKPNYNTWDNSMVRDLLLRAQRSVDDSERDRLYKQAAEVIRTEIPKVPFAHTTPPLLARNYVTGFVTNPTSTEFFKTVRVNK
jgi:peptide/nickel transport system substrate-binding protein